MACCEGIYQAARRDHLDEGKLSQRTARASRLHYFQHNTDGRTQWLWPVAGAAGAAGRESERRRRGRHGRLHGAHDGETADALTATSTTAATDVDVQHGRSLRLSSTSRRRGPSALPCGGGSPRLRRCTARSRCVRLGDLYGRDCASSITAGSGLARGQFTASNASRAAGAVV